MGTAVSTGVKEPGCDSVLNILGEGADTGVGTGDGVGAGAGVGAVAGVGAGGCMTTGDGTLIVFVGAGVEGVNDD